MEVAATPKGVLCCIGQLQFPNNMKCADYLNLWSDAIVRREFNLTNRHNRSSAKAEIHTTT